MKFGASQLRFEDLHYSLSDGYVATRLLFRLICNLPEYSIRILCFGSKTIVPTDMYQQS